jgi:hypothetical protein
MQRTRVTGIVVDRPAQAPATIVAARDGTAGVARELVSTIEAQLNQLRSIE